MSQPLSLLPRPAALSRYAPLTRAPVACALLACALLACALSACGLRTECVTGMTSCSTEGHATQRCERGFWVEDTVCGEGAACVMMEDESGEEHSATPHAMCEPAEAGVSAGASGASEAGTQAHNASAHTP